MAKRTKKVILSGVTSEQMESAFSIYATADAKLAKINAMMDEQITRIREKYSDEIATLSDLRDKNFEVVQIYAQENRDVIFSKKKSLEAAHGTYGFRTGTPKLKTLKGFTWASAEKLVQDETFFIELKKEEQESL